MRITESLLCTTQYDIDITQYEDEDDDDVGSIYSMYIELCFG